MLSFRLKINKDQALYIEHGKFKGDVDKVQKALEAYVENNTLSFQGFRGYGTLTVNDKNHSITPYGIDISMMLEFCEIDLSRLEQEQEPDSAPSTSYSM